MGLIYCGIDEAGYGPMLGPLCVGFSAFRVEAWTEEAGAPDLWELLAPAVCRAGSDRAGRIAIADSKKLKLANQSRTRHPLTHLERGVLVLAGLVGARTVAGGEQGGEQDSDEGGSSHAGGVRAGELDTDERLFAALGVRLEAHEWYGGRAVDLPLAGSASQIAIARNTLALACSRAGVEPLALACMAVGEVEFNDAVRSGQSKAALTERCFARYLRRCVERWGSGGDRVRIVCDRHGGRTSYSAMIAGALRGTGDEVETLEESGRCSRYAIRRAQAASGTCGVVVQFRPEAEDAHLPVALASMTAKLVRELAMGRFNRYWCARAPELRPTAGYVQDARRWLAEARCVVREEEREAMVRMA